MKALTVGSILLDFLRDCTKSRILHTATFIIHSLLLALCENGKEDMEVTQCSTHMMRYSHGRNCNNYHRFTVRCRSLRGVWWSNGNLTLCSNLQVDLEFCSAISFAQLPERFFTTLTSSSLKVFAVYIWESKVKLTSYGEWLQCEWMSKNDGLSRGGEVKETALSGTATETKLVMQEQSGTDQQGQEQVDK